MTIVDMLAGWRAMGYKTYGTKIALVRDEAKTITDGGIIIPDTATDKPLVGTIIDIGNAVVEEGLDYGFKIGDRVLFSKYGGTMFMVRMPDGSDMKVELIHAKDVYVGWEEDIEKAD